MEKTNSDPSNLLQNGNETETTTKSNKSVTVDIENEEHEASHEEHEDHVANHGDDNFLCMHCGDEFKEEQSMQIHEDKEHRTVKATDDCLELPRSSTPNLPTGWNMKDTTPKKHDCDMCDYNADFILEVWRHKARDHGDCLDEDFLIYALAEQNHEMFTRVKQLENITVESAKHLEALLKSAVPEGVSIQTK